MKTAMDAEIWGDVLDAHFVRPNQKDIQFKKVLKSEKQQIL